MRADLLICQAREGADLQRKPIRFSRTRKQRLLPKHELSRTVYAYSIFRFIIYVKACKFYNDGGAPMLRHDLAFTHPTDYGWLGPEGLTAG